MSRPLLPWAALAVLGAVSLAWLGLLGFVFTDYELEAAPALDALVRGWWVEFLELCPAYGGSLILRAPFALGADALGGGDVAVFRAVGMPCLLAGSALGVVLAGSLLARRAGRGTVAAVVLLCAANPITLRALDIGHPEELLGAALCAGAVLAGVRDRPALAGVLLGLALANKAWAVLAVGPVLLALPSGRWRALGIAGAIAGVIMLPLLLGGVAERDAGGRGADQRDLPALAGVVVPRLGRRGDPRRRRPRQGGLPRGAGLAVADQPPADRRGGRAAHAARVAAELRPAAAARAAVHAALRAGPVEHRLLRAAGDHGARDVGVVRGEHTPVSRSR